MKMTAFATILLTCATIMACGDTPTQDNPTSQKKAQSDAATAENTEQSDAISPLYKDGVNDQNRGDKTGKVRIHGTINANGGGQVTLSESEGRNYSVIATTQLSNRQFDFGEIEVGRGFYKISLNGESNAADIILNPDESDLELTFNASRLSANRAATGSNENSGWFDYKTKETTNANEVRKLRQSIKDAGAFRSRIEEQIKQKEKELVDQQHALMDQYPWNIFGQIPRLEKPQISFE